MRKKIQSIILCLILIFTIFTTIDLVFEFASTSGSITIYVPTNYPTIQDAINAAKDGDTVYVFSGTYYENVLVNKTINLTGENRDNTIIDVSDGVVRITSDYVNVSGFTITGATTTTGIIIESDYDTIAGNKFSTTEIGIYISRSNGINVMDNNMFDNGIYIEGDSLEHWNTHNIDISNTVNDRPIHYWKDRTEGMVPFDAGQVILANCTNVNVEAQAITNVYVGISLGFSFNNNIINNGVSLCRNAYSIYLYHSSGNNIVGNFVQNNAGIGLYLHHSNGNNISGNTFINNSVYGIHLINSDGNYIMGNILDNNEYHFIYLSYSSSNNISGNTISNNQYGDGVRLINSHGNYIAGNIMTSLFWGDGIHLEYSDGNYIGSNNASSNPIGIRLIYSSNNTIENNTCDGCTWGIELTDSHGNTVKNNHLYGDGIKGISIIVSNETNIVGNNISHSGAEGIYVGSSYRNNIIGNIIFSIADNGIELADVHESYFFGNKITSNEESGIFFEGICKRNAIHNNNITNNKHGLYLFRFSDNNIITDNIISSNNYDGILLDLSSNNKITGNDISGNLRGINLSAFSFSSSKNVISGNNISNNTHGIWLSSALNNAIIGNNITLNSLDGIHLLSSSNWNGILGNTVFSNGNYGIYLNDSSNNSIYHNNIINNAIQAYDGTNNANRWDEGYPSGGNYWSDFDESSEGAYDEYNGEGQNILGSDGIVDNGTIGGGGKNPYIIDSDSQDNYPLIEPNKNYMILKQGWNLISLPLIQEEQNLTKVLGSINGLYDAVQWYNITDKKDQWKHYKVGKPYGNDLSELNEKMGIWIHITQPGDTVFFYNGTRPTENQNIALHPGWNMVGYPSQNNRDRTSALNNIDFPSDVDAIWTYNSRVQRWEKMGSSDYFEVGRGYYVHSRVDDVWQVPL
ncbi:MAG: right-handed parallel beta-helix repeat-containing protein [Thermoplasmata archaeon]|nr:MAG: right-handed parallel beta-helix repeat-containing protein [Thermoplasmata archaeon]